ncbi:ATP-binding cassette domain-containing protein, partial [Roseomonas sp. TAS13]
MSAVLQFTPPEVLLRVSEATRSFRAPRGGRVQALRGVSLAVRRGEVLGIVGESGCGKSTLARLLVGLDSPDGGQVSFGGDDLAALRGATRRRFHRRAQMVFQDPHTSLNPRLTVGETLGEALRVHGIVPVPQIAGRVAELLASVNLPPEAA